MFALPPEFKKGQTLAPNPNLMMFALSLGFKTCTPLWPKKKKNLQMIEKKTKREIERLRERVELSIEKCQPH